MRRFLCSIFLTLLALTATVSPEAVLRVDAARGGTIPVAAVDPPNWWVGHPKDTIQIVIRSGNLTGATLSSSTAGVEVLSQKVNAAGSVMVARVHIAADAEPGAVDLTFSGPGGTGVVPFSLLARRSPAGRFAGFSPDDVIYLVMPDRFADGDPANNDPAGSEGFYNRKQPFAYHGGDFAGLIEHLPYLKDLGVTAIWLNPVYDNNDRGADYHGYGATDFYSVEEHFGTLDGFRALVDAAHAEGIKIIQDQVANHTGPQHPWVANYPTPTWYNGTPTNHLDNVFDIASIVYSDSDPARRRATLEGWFGGFLPDLNQNDPDAAEYLIQNSIWWVEQTGLDGIRQDTLPYAPRTYWAAWMTELKRAYPNLTVVGEVFNGDPKITSFFQGGVTQDDGVDSKVDTVFDFPLAFQIARYVLTGRDVEFIPDLFDQDFRYPNASVLVTFIGNHDISRQYTQSKDIRPLMLAQTILLTMRGTPQLYYGDEIAMKGGGDPDNRRDFPGGFPGDKKNAFSTEGRTKKQNKVYAHVRTLIALRKSIAALRGSETRFVSASGGTLAYLRGADGQAALVVVNNSDAKLSTTLSVGAAFADGATLSDGLGSAASVRVSGGKVKVALGARSSAVFAP